MSDAATVTIPVALHDALRQWAEFGFDDFGDFFFDLVQAATDAGYGTMPDDGVTGMAYAAMEVTDG